MYKGLLERVQVRRDMCTRCFFLDLAIIYRKSLYACVLHRIYDECLSEKALKEKKLKLGEGGGKSF